MTSWFLAFFISAITAWIATRGMIEIGISDSPDEARKLHKKTTPTSGGVGIMVGILAGVVFAVWQGTLALSISVIVCLMASLIGGALGLLDDIYALGPKLKLSVMLLAVTCFVVFGARIEFFQLAPTISWQLGPVLGALGSVFWLLMLVNTVNFMDGANGMAMGCAGIGLFGLFCLVALSSTPTSQFPDVSILGWIGCAACLGFLFWNVLHGRVFAGDSGALFVGLFCGTLGILAVVTGVNPLSVATCFLPMLVDVILTIILRLKRRENVLQGHAHHAYQIAIRRGSSHLATSLRYWGYTVFSVVGAVIAHSLAGFMPLGAFLAILALLCLAYWKSVRAIGAQPSAELPH